jgi:cold shock CspA family protein
MKRMTGTIVRWFGGTRNYGFIQRDGRLRGESDVFVHVTELRCEPAALQQGVRVEFEKGVDAAGRERAKNVCLAV